jgi:hypothetical protein
MLYAITTYKSRGGRSSHKQFANTFHVQSEDAHDSAAMRAVAEYIAEAERTALLSGVHLIRARISRIKAAPNEFVGRQHTTIELGGKGARHITVFAIEVGSADPVYRNPSQPEEMCVEIRQQASGTVNGRHTFRGMLMKDDVRTSEDGSLELVPNTPLNTDGEGQTSFLAQLNAGLPSGEFVQLKKDADGIVTPIPVTNFILTGITLRQRYQPRRTASSRLVYGVQMQLNEYSRKVKQIFLAPEFFGDAADSTARLILLRQEAAAIYNSLMPEQKYYVNVPENLSNAVGQ